jgi:diguanylate cyclase (GGDEF)-like protein
MNRARQHLYRHVFLGLLLVSASFVDLVYKLYFGQHYNPYISCAIVVAALFTLISFYHAWYLRPYTNMVNILNEYYDEALSETAAVSADEISKNSNSNYDKVPYVVLEKLIEHYRQHHDEQAMLVDKLKISNMLLEQNNRFANAIVQITGEILRSGDIRSILQLILDKAIELIPNAQNGSILLCNGNCLEYRAMHGYNIDALKDFNFSIEEIFQYGADDLYAPIVIHDVEEFNRKLKKDKFDMLKESRSFELKSCLSCAISIDNQFYGIINIDNADDGFAFSEEHKPIIKYFAEQIGIALKNAQLLEKTLYLSRYDSLTGISNRSHFEEQLNTIYQDAKAAGACFCLATFDMNNLKYVNDNFGHEAGDMLLVTFTNYISHLQDKPAVFGRIGGDEFALIYKGKSKEEVSVIINSITEHFTEVPFRYNDMDIMNITYGFGISCYPAEASDIPGLFMLADKLMYSEKRKSKRNNQGMNKN